MDIDQNLIPWNVILLKNIDSEKEQSCHYFRYVAELNHGLMTQKQVDTEQVFYQNGANSGCKLYKR